MKFWICLVISVINLTAFSQVVLDISLLSDFKSQPIKKNRIQPSSNLKNVRFSRSISIKLITD